MLEKKSSQYKIGLRIFEAINYTFFLLYICSCITSYFLIQENPRNKRIESRASSLVSLAALVNINLSISDFAEVIRLLRSFQYPTDALSVTLKVHQTKKVLIREELKKNIENISHEYTQTRISGGEGHFNSIFEKKYSFYSRAYRYQYLMKGVGPNNSDVEMNVSIDDTPYIINDILKNGLVFLFLTFFFFMNVFFLKKTILKLLNPLNNLFLYLQDNKVKNEEELTFFQVPEEITGNSLEIKEVVLEYNALLESNKSLCSLLMKNKMNEELGKMSAQVSHDIRSPLTALTSSARTWLHILPEEERIIVRAQIQRIQDIANELLIKRKEIQSGQKQEASYKRCSQMLSSCIEEIVTEKRMAFRHLLDLHIEAITDQTYGIFAKVSIVEFKRLLSNLINNATEAYDDKKGRIKIRLSEDQYNAIITISDKGKGIPPHILKKLGEEGVSYGKVASSSSGNGLGIPHAKRTIEEWGGTLSLESQEGVGTKVIVTLPKSQTPDWFVPKIELCPQMNVVILDDDQGIHQTWDKKIGRLSESKSCPVSITHLSTPLDFSDWVSKNHKNCKNILYLCDYELLGHLETGLDLIEKNHIQQNAYLVTSHYEDEQIRSRCRNLGVKLIPKMLADLVPLEVSHVAQEDLSHISAVLVEDDEFICMDWRRWAKKEKKSFLSFNSPFDFLKISTSLSKEECEIFIDRELGDGLPKGEEIAQELYEKGFKNLCLTTGHDPSMFAHLPWLKCQGKMCPWSTYKDGWT